MEHDYRAVNAMELASVASRRDYATASTPIRRGEIQTLTEELVKASESVLVRLNQLQVPLSPILQPEVPKGSAGLSQQSQEPAPQSELGRMLFGALRSMREAHASLTDLEQRLML